MMRSRKPRGEEQKDHSPSHSVAFVKFTLPPVAYSPLSPPLLSLNLYDSYRVTIRPSCFRHAAVADLFVTRVVLAKSFPFLPPSPKPRKPATSDEDRDTYTCLPPYPKYPLISSILQTFVPRDIDYRAVQSQRILKVLRQQSSIISDLRQNQPRKGKEKQFRHDFQGLQCSAPKGASHGYKCD